MTMVFAFLLLTPFYYLFLGGFLYCVGADPEKPYPIGCAAYVFVGAVALLIASALNERPPHDSSHALGVVIGEWAYFTIMAGLILYGIACRLKRGLAVGYHLSRAYGFVRSRLGTLLKRERRQVEPMSDTALAGAAVLLGQIETAFGLLEQQCETGDDANSAAAFKKLELLVKGAIEAAQSTSCAWNDAACDAVSRGESGLCAIKIARQSEVSWSDLAELVFQSSAEFSRLRSVAVTPVPVARRFRRKNST